MRRARSYGAAVVVAVPLVVLGGALGCGAVLGIGDPVSEGADASTDGPSSDGPSARLAIAPRPLALAGYGGCAIVKDGSVWCWTGDPSLADFLAATPDAGITDSFAHPVAGLPAHAVAVAVAEGVADACAAFENGDVWCWGARVPPARCQGELDCLGRGDYPAPPIAPRDVCQEAALEAFGFEPRTGLPSKTPGGVPQRIAVPAEVRFTDVVMGADHACALDPSTGGGVYCWGDDLVGAVGSNYPPTDGFVPHRVSAPKKVLENGTRALHTIVAGFSSTCAIGDGPPYCWGDDPGGALGIGPSAMCRRESTVAERHPCVLAPTETALGMAETGPLFNLSTASCFVGPLGQYACVGSTGSCVFGADTTQNHPTAVILDAGLVFEADAALSGGTGSVLCAIAADGGLSCLGAPGPGLLGAGVQTVDVPQDPLLTFGPDGGAASQPGGTRPCVLSPVHLDVRDDAGAPIAVLGFVTCSYTMGAIGADGRVYVWGLNASGALGHTPGSLGDDANGYHINPTPRPVTDLPPLF